MNTDLTGRRALVTGGTRGLGRAIAETLIGQGVGVVVSGNNPDGCRAAQEELGSDACVVRADICDLEATKSLIAQAADTLGGIDILVNNAGHFAGGSLLEITDEQWLQELDIKLFGAIRTTREALPHLLDGGGVIVNIAGGSAYTAGGIASISGINNSGMITFTAYLAREFGPQGVRAVGISPGMTLTPSWQSRAQDIATARGVTVEAALQGLLDAQGAGHSRWIRPEEIGQLVAFVVSDSGHLINGTTIRANAGQSVLVG